MKVIFFGTPQFAVPFLDHLEENDEIEIEAIVTQPDKPVGRKMEIAEPPVKKFAKEAGITVLQPEKIKDNPEFINLLKGLNPDFIVVIAYGAILPREILDIPKYDCINIHASLLPKYRGASPIQSALLNGDNKTGLSFMSLDENLDTGDIYLLKKFNIGKTDTSKSLSEKLSNFGAVMLPYILHDIKDGIFTPIPQDESLATYCHKISKTDALVNPKEEKTNDIYNKLRAFTPWPGIYMIFKNKRLKLLEMNIHNGREKINAGMLKNSDGKILLGTKDGTLEITKLQPEGKRPLSAKEFINGFLS
ncbi:methionyl-tRNA formyltransferase [bacterium]|nr:methionyl-tRNA formyltransferase [bacterium]